MDKWQTMTTDKQWQSDHSDRPASCICSSGRTRFLQMIIWMDHPLANDHPDRLAYCKWSSRWAGLMQMTIWIDWLLTNDHLDWLVSCKWSSGWTSLLQIILIFLFHYFSPLQKHVFVFQIFYSISLPVNFLLRKKAYFRSPNIFPVFLSSEKRLRTYILIIYLV